MFMPNTTCQLYRQTGARDVYSQFTFNPPVTVPCSVITLDFQIKKTSVRVDSSASRGRAEEEVGLARLLFPPTVNLKEGDIVSVEGQALEVSRLFPRRDSLGALDHIQVDFRKGALPA